MKQIEVTLASSSFYSNEDANEKKGRKGKGWEKKIAVNTPPTASRKKANIGEFNGPYIAFTQHHTVSMRVEENYWENATSYFTDHVYEIGIAQACALGNISPLMGHNVMLQVKALEESKIIDK